MIIARLFAPLGITRPQSVLAWSEPDPPAEADADVPSHDGRQPAP